MSSKRNVVIAVMIFGITTITGVMMLNAFAADHDGDVETSQDGLDNALNRLFSVLNKTRTDVVSNTTDSDIMNTEQTVSLEQYRELEAKLERTETELNELRERYPTDNGLDTPIPVSWTASQTYDAYGTTIIGNGCNVITQKTTNGIVADMNCETELWDHVFEIHPNFEFARYDIDSCTVNMYEAYDAFDGDGFDSDGELINFEINCARIPDTDN